MTRSTTIETTWSNLIWANESITQITDKIHKYVVKLESEKEIGNLYYDGRINYIQALTARGQRFGQTATAIGGLIDYGYIVEVTYTLEADTGSEAFIAVRDFFESLFELVNSELGDSWGSTVDFSSPPIDPPTITQISIDNKTCWRGVATYRAQKQVES